MIGLEFPTSVGVLEPDLRSSRGVRSVASVASCISSTGPDVTFAVWVVRLTAEEERSMEDESEGQVLEILRAKENSSTWVCGNVRQMEF